MDCTITSSKTDKARCQGLTLIEMMLATGLGTLVLAAVMALSSFSARSFAAVGNYVDLDSKSRKALDRMSQDIREVDSVLSCGRSGDTTEAVFTGTNFSTGAPYTLTYTHRKRDKKLTRTLGVEQQVLLTECDSMDWYMYQRGMTNGTDSPIPTTDPARCKVIQFNWVCSRQILGAKANTESVQSAEIMIRKK